MISARQFQMIALCAAATGAACVIGCSSSSPATTLDAATPDAATPDATTSVATTSAYTRLGGHAGLLAFVKGEVENKVLKDSNLKTYFFNQVASPIPAGHPSAGQIEECFTRFVASVIVAETYPGIAVSDATNMNTPNFTCRDMKTSHTGLRIGDKTFDTFVGVLAADLMPLVVSDGTALTIGHISQTEFNALAAALTGTKPSIVDTTAPSGPAPFTP